MRNDPFHRLFAHEQPDESVDLLFTFLSELTDLYFEAYQELIVRMVQEDNPPAIAPDKPPDLDNCNLDDKIPFQTHPTSSRAEPASPSPSFNARHTTPCHLQIGRNDAPEFA